MFTVKLIKHEDVSHSTQDSDPINSEYSVSISCARYDVDRRDGHAFVIPHSDYVNASSVEFHIGGDSGGPNSPFSVAFVENEKGKTIDRIGPYEKGEQ